MTSATTRLVKNVFGEGSRMRFRRLGRLRWITKFRVLQHFGIRIIEKPAVALPYLLWDPEVDSFTYGISNQDELAVALGRVVGRSTEEVRAAIAEGEADSEFMERLPTRMRFAFRYKHRVGLNGQQLATWALVRLTRPKLVVETGVLDGLGSLVALRALELNRYEGDEGILMSFDGAAGTGWLVPEDLRCRWHFVQQLTTEALERELAGRRVDMFIHDTDLRVEHQRWEFGVAVSHAADRIVLMAASDHGPALREVTEEAGGCYEHFVDVPTNHFYRGARLGFAVVTRRDSGEDVGLRPDAPG